MKISMIGTGYVGLVTGTCLAEFGNKVICADTDEEKIQCLRDGKIPIFEPGLEEMIARNTKSDRLLFTASIKEAVESSDICFIAVGTPINEDGSANLQYVLSAAASIGKYMTHNMYVAIKSTVPVGTSKKIKAEIQKALDERKCDITFELISNPEFLKEGSAVRDAMNPDRIVIGADNETSFAVIKKLYEGGGYNIICMDPASAEMTKYAANCMLATKISFINEISNLCEKLGADVNKVRMGIGSDHRIGFDFINPGCGYGGSCLPKDVQALIKTAEECGEQALLLQSVHNVNFSQKHILIDKIVKKFGANLKGRIFGVWGLSFKPETDDMREAASVVIIKELVKMGAKVKAYDPKATENARSCYLKDVNSVEFVSDKYSALTDADAMILVTEWSEFKSPDFEDMKRRMKEAVVFDGRNQYDENITKKYGFSYYRIGGGEQPTPFDKQ